jgi:DNA-binding SARP family transcriptional activator
VNGGRPAHAICLLGPTRVRTVAGETSLRPSLRRSLLELLAMRAGETVPIGPVVEELWAGAPPERPVQAVQAHVRRLRRTLAEAGVPTRVLPILLTGGGFVLDVPAAEVDALHMVALVEAATRIAADHAGEAIPVLQRALAMWTGEPFGGIADGPEHRSAVRYWGEVRMLALRSWAAAHLRLGRPQPVVTRFHAGGLHESTDEGVTALLISALCQVGRRVEALSVYRAFRRRLVDEHGVEPSAELQRFHRRILLDERETRFAAVTLPGILGG